MSSEHTIETPRNALRPEGTDWDEQYAYSLGIQAYIWGFPWIYLSQLAWLWTSIEGEALLKKEGKQAPYAPMNSFFNAPQLTNSDYQNGGAPNCDTLYSTAWLNLSREPLVLSVPAVTDRFYSMQLAGIDSDNFAYVGGYATGSEAGNYLIALPDWHGDVPGDLLDILPRSRTPVVFVLGRTGVNNSSEEDLNAAHAVQAGYKLTPLSRWIDPSLPPETPPHALVPVGFDYNHTEGAWATMNCAMTQNPPGVLAGVNQEGLIKLFATVGVGPNQHLELQSQRTQMGLQRAAKDGLALMKEMAKGRGKVVNHWNYPPLDYGRAGVFGDYITRAALQAMGGIVANDPNEATYLNTTVDSNNEELSTSKRYKMVFDKATGGFPPLVEGFHGFWSVTMYGSDLNLPKGSSHYNVNSHDPKFSQLAPDGSLTILIQRDQPQEAPGVYWLQTPDRKQAKTFFLVLRVYIPGPEVSATQRWQPPSLDPQNEAR